MSDDIADLLQLLRHRDAVVRARAAEEIGRTGKQEHVVHLLPVLKDRVGEVRGAAAVALGSLKAAKAATDIVPLLADRVPIVRARAAWALGEMSARDAAKQIEPLLDDRDDQVRRTAKAVLRQLAPEAVRKIVTDLTGESVPAKVAALQRLLTTCDKSYTAAIVPLLKHPFAEVRRLAVLVLWQSGAREHEQDILALRNDADWMVRSGVADALQGIDPERHREVIGALRREMDSAMAFAPKRADAGPAMRRTEEARAIGTSGDPARGKELLPYLKDADAHVRGTAAWSLGQTGARGLAMELVPLLAEVVAHVRDAARDALTFLGAHECIGALSDLLSHADGGVRAAAAHVLALTPNSGLADRLPALLEDADARVRIATARAVGELRSVAQRNALERLQQDGDVQVRLSAAMALLRLGALDAAAQGRLLDDVMARDDHARCLEMADALASVHEPEAYAILNQCVAPVETVDLADFLRREGLHLVGARKFGDCDLQAGWRCTPRALLLHVCDAYGDAYVIERGRVRVCNRIELAEIWRDRLPVRGKAKASRVDGTGAIDGVVTDEATGGPVAGARILLRPFGLLAELDGIMQPVAFRECAKTDKEGRFRAAKLQARRYQVDVVAPGYVSHRGASMIALQSELTAAAGTDEGTTSLFNLDNGHTPEWFDERLGGSQVVACYMPTVGLRQATQISVRLKPARPIRGLVLSVDGRPLADVEVLVAGYKVPQVHQFPVTMPTLDPVKTGADGCFVVWVHAESEVSIVVHADGWSESRRTVHAASADELEFRLTNDDRVLRCQSLIARLEEALKQHELYANHYPPSGNAEMVKVLKGAFIKLAPEDLNERGEVIDPWGHPLVYVNCAMNFPMNLPDATQHNKTSVDLYSFGPNGVDEQGGGDDVTNWT